MQIRRLLTSKLLNIFSVFLGTIAVAVIFLLSTKAEATYDLYLDQLRLMDIAVDDYLNEEHDIISRYELTKLLNTVECQDCIHPAQSMIEIYTQAFWESFIQLPGKDFDEIDYLGGLYKENSYYYCVAYVGDHKYMRGYPESISPVCAGMFCGAKSVTKAEFIQVIINLLSDYIYPQYSASWSDISKWTKKMKAGSQADGYVEADDKNLISQKAIDCPEGDCKLESASEFKTYLKYCMFNIDACEMQSFGKIGQGYWPVAELNVLYNQNILDHNEAQKEDIHAAAKGSVVLETLYKLYEFVDCEFNNDYDCDSLDNAGDNCQNKYNPSQLDTDNDGIGDVCDDDIDGDGILNPVGIVDELGRLNIGVATTGMDNCLLTQNSDQEITQHAFIGDACFDNQDKLGLYIAPENIKHSAPTEVSFEAITKGTLDYIERDMGDGTHLEGKKISHYYRDPGPYTITAIAHGPHNDANAKVSIILGENVATYHAVQILANKLGSDGPDNILFGTEYAGQADEIIWDFGDKKAPVSKDATGRFNKFFEKAGEYPVTSQTHLNGQLLGASQMIVGIGDNTHGLAIKSNKIQIELEEEIKIQSSSYGFSSNDINYIKRDFGDGNSEISKATQTTYSYKSLGSKIISQTVFLKNGKMLTAYITVFVNDPTHTTSHTLQLTPNTLWLKKGEESSFSITPMGDSLTNTLGIAHVLEYQHIPFDVQRIFSPENRPIESTSLVHYQEGVYYPKSRLVINQCQSLENQATIVVHGLDMCLEALLMGELDQFSCDMDGDEIPDVCDNDIDGDGVENLIGVITYENDDCSITADNIDPNILDDHLKGVCLLDNCPFSINSDQDDLNIDYIGDVCEDVLSILLDDLDAASGNDEDSDNDGDGIADATDQCPELAENFNGINDLDGCPEIDTEENCFPYEESCTDVLCPGACFSCPCQFADYANDLAPGDKVKANLFDFTRSYFYDDSLPVLIDNYIDFELEF